MFSHSPGGGTVWNVLERCRHPLATLFVIALAVRLIIMPLVSHDFDIYHWALVIENIQTGDELYGLDGYYYTPTWGYVLAFFSLMVSSGSSMMRNSQKAPSRFWYSATPAAK